MTTAVYQWMQTCKAYLGLFSQCANNVMQKRQNGLKFCISQTTSNYIDSERKCKPFWNMDINY